jgi:hypothetical protein
MKDLVKTLFLDKNKFPFQNIHWMIEGIVNIIDGIIKLGTFGFYHSSLSISYIEWTFYMQCKFLINNKKNIQ